MDDGYRINSEGKLVIIEELRGKPITECICNALEDDECICGYTSDEGDDTMGKYQEVFLLVESVDYKGDYVLGVYSTWETAQEAADAWKNPCDNVYVYAIYLDAPAETSSISLKARGA